MSRDYTPLERYASNKYISQKYPGEGDMWLHNIEMVNMETGESRKFFTEEEQEIRKHFRFLAITMGDHFLKLYYKLPEEKRESRLYVLENIIQALQLACEKGKNAFDEADVPETIKEWYVGKLDPDFYYSETNDELFYEWCLEEFFKREEKSE